jgi:hypothetical protein
MIALLRPLLLGLLLCVVTLPCFGLHEVMPLTRERAEKEFGIRIHSKHYDSGQLNVWVEFQPKDKLAGFLHVNLEITDGNRRVVSAVLASTKEAGDRITAAFQTEPAFLPGCTLTIVVRGGERTFFRYDLKVADFVTLAPAR